MPYGEIERIKRTSLIKIPHSGRTIGRHRLQRQPWEGRSTHICTLKHEIGRPEGLSRRFPKVERHGGEGNSYVDSERQNHLQKSSLNPLFILPKQPNEKSNCNRNRQEQALVWAAIEQERQADSHPRRVTDSLFFLDPGQSTHPQPPPTPPNPTTPLPLSPLPQASN